MTAIQERTTQLRTEARTGNRKVSPYVVTVIIGAVRASSGEAFRYPLTIRFVK